MRVTTESTGISRIVWVGPAGGAGRGGSWVPFGRSQRRPSFGPKQQEREEIEGIKKWNCGEMVSLGRRQPQAPLDTAAAA